MKALSIRQPWAWLIVNGHKDIENRSWKTNHRGDFLIHAGNQVDRDFFAIQRQVLEEFGVEIPDWHDLPTKGIVGAASLMDCVEKSDSPWWQRDTRYGFVLENAIKLPFQPCGGMLQFFDTPFEVQIIDGNGGFRLTKVPRKVEIPAR